MQNEQKLPSVPAPTTQTFTHRLRSADGHTILVCELVRPTGLVRGIVQISHGMCEHMKRYQPFMLFLAEHGFLVCGHDHIGHGRSCPQKNLLGFFGEENGHRVLVEDLHLVNDMLRDQFPHLPLFLFGHSMGSLVARLYLAKYPESLTGILLCGTAGRHPASRAGLALCDRIISKKGPLYTPPTVDRLLFGAYNKHFRPIRTQKDWLTRDAAVCDRYLADPNCMFLFTVSGYRDLLLLQYYCNTPAWYRTLPSNLPCLLLSGDQDPVGDYGKGIQRVYRRMKRAGVADLTLRLYPGARHELLNELNFQEVQQDILAWLCGRLPLTEPRSFEKFE